MPFRVRSFRILSLLAVAACTTRDEPRRDSTAGAPAASAPPAWLQPIFRELDTLLTDGQRDTLRRLTLDSAFAYRVRRLGPIVTPGTAVWVRTPAGDTIIARGETLNSAVPILSAPAILQRNRAGSPS